MYRTAKSITALVFLVCSTAAMGDWTTYEETNLKGTISGTIMQGHVFQTQSGSIYEVTDITLQLVLQIMPKVVVLRNGDQYKLIIDGFDAPLICKQLALPARLATPTRPRPDNDDPPTPAPDGKKILNKLLTKTQQKEMGLNKLTDSERDRLGKYLAELYLRGVADGKKLKSDDDSQLDTKTPAQSVIESTVDGAFKGWKGETVFKLTNGQIWQQAEYRYHYHYAYRPSVLIYQSDGVYKMKVEGVDEAVMVKRIK